MEPPPVQGWQGPDWTCHTTPVRPVPCLATWFSGPSRKEVTAQERPEQGLSVFKAGLVEQEDAEGQRGQEKGVLGHSLRVAPQPRVAGRDRRVGGEAARARKWPRAASRAGGSCFPAPGRAGAGQLLGGERSSVFPQSGAVTHGAHTFHSRRPGQAWR